MAAVAKRAYKARSLADFQAALGSRTKPQLGEDPIVQLPPQRALRHAAGGVRPLAHLCLPLPSYALLMPHACINS